MSNCVQLQCDFEDGYINGPTYVCDGTLTTTFADNIVDSVTGDHQVGRNNDDVTAVSFESMTLEVLPKNLDAFFTNFTTLALVKIAKLQNFKRRDFSDFTRLENFLAMYIESITTLPRDTFFDLTNLRALYLDGNRNMENLHADLLINQRQLTMFTARGPNRINQISPGFFRNQMDTIQAVAFTGTNLLRVGHSVFENMPSFLVGRFRECGCLNADFPSNADLTAAVRANCQDVISPDNRFFHKKVHYWNSDSSE